MNPEPVRLQNLTCLLIAIAVSISMFSLGCKSMPGFANGDAPAVIGTSDWLDSFEEAKTIAGQTGKPILINFTGSDWCTWCKMLKREVFETAEFKTWADRNVVLLELDFPRNRLLSSEIQAQNAELSKTYSINSYPTAIFVDSTGQQIGREFGYVKGGPTAWIAEANKQLR